MPGPLTGPGRRCAARQRRLLSARPPPPSRRARAPDKQEIDMRIPKLIAPVALIAGVFALAGAVFQTQQAEIQYYGNSRLFSNAVRVGNTVYLSGKIGRGADIEAQTRAAMESVKSGLEEVGATMDDVVKCLVMLSDMAHYNGMNAVYTEYFP